MILGIPANAITHDYRLSDEGLVSEREARLAEMREIGLTEEWGNTAADFVERISQHLETRYRGLDNYLDGIGFDSEHRARLIELIGA